MKITKDAVIGDAEVKHGINLTGEYLADCNLLLDEISRLKKICSPSTLSALVWQVSHDEVSELDWPRADEIAVNFLSSNV